MCLLFQIKGDFWKITVSGDSETIDTSDVAAADFDIYAEFKDGMMFLSLTGRIYESISLIDS